jgi:hypothetical protein
MPSGTWREECERETAARRGATALCSGIVALALCITLAAGCESEAARSDKLAHASGFTRQVVTGRGFRHVVYGNSVRQTSPTLHVYIEGDGTPFKDRHTVADDPTSTDPLMLKLMALDPTRSIELGRPCYTGLSRDAGCGPLYWTSRRYGPEVVQSMVAALQEEALELGATHIELFGHSGGGTLALLVAEHVRSVDRVVTIGANLDIDVWCRLHGYSPLEGSINPTRAARLDAVVLHLVGANDTNTPPWLVQAAAQRRGGEAVQVVPGFDHRCCWQTIWPDVLIGPRRSPDLK